MAITVLRTPSGDRDIHNEIMLDESIGNTGEYRMDGDGAWLMSEEDADWWEDWAERQERIEDALDYADAYTVAEALDAVDSDLGASQRRQCDILGIPYGYGTTARRGARKSRSDFIAGYMAGIRSCRK